MSPYVKALVKETGQSENDIKKLWEKAKASTSEAYGVKEEVFESKHFEYAKRIVLSHLGVDERFSVAEFIKSEKSAKDFIEEAVQSSTSFGIDSVMTHKEEPYKDEEEEEDEDEEETEEDRLYKRDGTGPHGQGAGPGKGKADGTGLSEADERIFSGKVIPDDVALEEELKKVDENAEEKMTDEYKEELKEHELL